MTYLLLRACLVSLRMQIFECGHIFTVLSKRNKISQKQKKSREKAEGKRFLFSFCLDCFEIKSISLKQTVIRIRPELAVCCR